jgi:ATP-binding cassette subfamily A (ABC1) protein 3
LIGNPPIVLLDEPSAGMDPEARRFMWSVIHKLSKRSKKSSVILTTHSMEEAESLCRKMGIMVDGVFKIIGTAQEIKNTLGHEFEINFKTTTMSDEETSSIENQSKSFLNR